MGPTILLICIAIIIQIFSERYDSKKREREAKMAVRRMLGQRRAQARMRRKRSQS